MPDIGKVSGTVEMKDEFSSTFNKFSNGLKSTKVGFGVVAGAAVAAGAIIAKSVSAYNTQIQAVNKLNLALSNQGNLLPGTSKRLQEYASEIQRTTTFGDEQILAAQALGASFGFNEEVLKRVTSATVDLSAATGMDLKNTMQLMGRASEQGASALTRYGITIDKSIPKSQQFEAALAEIEKRFSGTAQLSADTFAGKLTQVSNATGDVMEKIGLFVEFLVNNFGGGIQSTLSILEGLGTFFGDVLPRAFSEAQAVFAEAMAAIFEGAAEVADVLEEIPGFETIFGDVDPEGLRQAAKDQRDLASSIREDSEAFLEAAANGKLFDNQLGDTNKSTLDNAEASKQAEAQLKAWSQAGLEHIDLLRQQKEAADAIATQAFDESMAKKNEEAAANLAKHTEEVRDAMVESLPPLSQFAHETTNNVERHKELVKSQEEFNKGIQAANQLAQLLGGTFGSVVGQITGMASTLKNLSVAGGGGFGGILGGLKGSFSDAFSEAGGGIFGAIAGAGAIAGPIAALAGPVISGISQLFKIGGPDISRDIARDLGPSISEGLEQAIEQSGKPVQLAVADIFSEAFASGDPAATVDKFAEEIGDILSGLSRGEFSQPEAIVALEQAIPMLIERFNELGPAGEEQVNRIIAAAQNMGIEFEGLNELIAAQMGPTLQDIAEQFGLSVEEARGLAETLGVDLPTQMQQLAAQIGTTPAALREVGAALEEQFGIPVEQIQALMESMGVDFAQLAESLGVQIPDAVGAGATETENLAANTEQVGNNLASATAQANALANALANAANASQGINIPSGGGIEGFAVGGIATSPTLKVFGEAGPEVAAPVSALFGQLGNEIATRVADAGGGGGTNNSIMIAPNLTVAEPLATPEAIQNAVLPPLIDAIRNDIRSVVGEITRKQERS